MFLEWDVLLYECGEHSSSIIAVEEEKNHLEKKREKTRRKKDTEKYYIYQIYTKETLKEKQNITIQMEHRSYTTIYIWIDKWVDINI